MIQISPHEQGFHLTWSSKQTIDVHAIRRELTFAGLRRERESPTGVVVHRYRNELETLQILTVILTRLGLEFSLDPALQSARNAAQVERDLIDHIRQSAGSPPKPMPATLPEFGENRRLLSYQREAVAKHLVVNHSADFSVPGAGKTTVALAYWSILRRTIPNVGLWIIGPLSCFRPWE